MPCRDYYDDHPDQYFKDVTEPALRAQVSFAESALCMVMVHLFEASFTDVAIETTSPQALWNKLYDSLDYKSAGIKQEEFIKWHKNHLELDRKHREEEERALLQKAIRKLSPDEYAAIRNQIINGA